MCRLCRHKFSIHLSKRIFYLTYKKHPKIFAEMSWNASSNIAQLILSLTVKSSTSSDFEKANNMMQKGTRNKVQSELVPLFIVSMLPETHSKHDLATAQQNHMLSIQLQ